MDITVAVAPDNSYFNKLEYENGTKIYKGLVFDILELLCPNCNYSYIQTESYTHPTTGVVALVENGKADIAVGSISMTYERIRQVDFLECFMISPISFLIGEQHPIHPILDFTKAFHPLLWLLAVVTLMTYIITVNIGSLWCSSKAKNTRTPVAFMEMTNNVIAIALRQGIAFVSHTNLRPSMICLVTSLLFGSLILTTSYTAKLISFRTVQVDRYIDTIEKLANHPEYDLIIYGDGISSEILQTKTKTFQALWGMVAKDIRRNVIDFNQEEQAGKRILKEKAAALFDRDTMRRMMKYNCGIRKAEDILFNDRLAFPVSREFKYKNMFNIRLLRMRESGLMEHMIERYIRLHDGPPLSCRDNLSGTSVTLSEVRGHMMGLAAGGLVACVVFVIEVIYAKFHFRSNLTVSWHLQ